MKRRHFLTRTGTALAGTRLAMSLPAAVATWASACATRDSGSPFRVLTPDEAADLEAIAARIVPSDGSPGAAEAGVIHFMDAALAGLRSDELEPVREGLAALRATVAAEYGAPAFSTLGAEEQVAALRGIEESEFFWSVRHLTLAGMFSHPPHGGNRGEVGWALIGFDLQGPAAPPFGPYDPGTTSGPTRGTTN